MPLYVYALVDDRVPLDATGVMNEPLSLLPAATGWLVVGTSAGAPPPPSAETLRAQDDLVRILATRADAVLPMRFGTSFENETALQDRMARFTSDRLRTALSRVRGCEQMTLRVFHTAETSASATAAAAATAAAPPPHGGASGATPGTAYLQQRAAALASPFPAALAAIRHTLADIVRDEILDATRRPPLLGSAYHLIARGDAQRYQTTLAAARTPPDLTVRVSGPSPTYAFAKDALP